MLLGGGRMSDHKGATLRFSALSRAREPDTAKVYDKDWFRALAAVPTRWLRRPSGHVRNLHRRSRLLQVVIDESRA